MIRTSGYKAFRGIMRIVPRGGKTKPFEQAGDWIYNPEYDVWYGGGDSYPARICEIVKDEGDYKK